MARIIIVDDDEILTEMISDALEDVGHMVSTLADGQFAIDAVMQSEPDLIILDHNMPGKSGMQVLREIRSLRLIYVPVLMLTAEISKVMRMRARMDGVDDYITKPIDTRELVSRVEGLLSQVSSTRNASYHKALQTN